MRKFVFSLQALYEVKAATEKQARTEYAAARRALDKAEEELKHCQQEFRSQQQRLWQSMQEGMPANEYQSCRLYIKLLQEKRDGLKKVKDDAEAAFTQKQQALQEVHQEKRALERVCESHRQAFMKIESQKEAKEMDDLLMPAMARDMRRRGDPA